MRYIAVPLPIQMFSIFLTWKCFCRGWISYKVPPSVPELLLWYHYHFYGKSGYYGLQFEQCVCFAVCSL